MKPPDPPASQSQPIRTRAEWRRQLEQAIRKQWPAASVKALEIVGKEHGWDKPPCRAATPPRLPDDPIERRKVQERHLLVRAATAEKAGSHVAARQYAADARDLRREIEQLEAEKLRQENAARDEGQILADFASDWTRLPIRLRERIREIVCSDG